MHIGVVGINHQTAPVTIRDRVAVSAGQLPDCLALLQRYVPQGIVLSTCNRTEIHTASAENLVEGSLSFLESRLSLPGEEWKQYLYTQVDENAVEHLFRVACGLDSLIVGEFEVLGQVRQALDAAERAGMVNLPLRHLFQSAVRAGRRVREETGISKNALSVSSVAVDLATRIVGDLSKCKMLVIGAGEVGRLVAKAARERGTSQITVASRTRERASEVAAAWGGAPIDLGQLSTELATVDIVVACTGAPHRILSAQQIADAMSGRTEHPLVIIDISLPRNVEPDAGQIEKVFLYNIDDLTQRAEQNRRQREGEIQKAAQIIADEVRGFSSWRHDFEVRPIIGALMSKAEEIRSSQVAKTLKRLPPLSEEQRESLEAMTKAIVTKILMEPIECLRARRNGDYAEIAKELFRLKGEAAS